jgi:Meiotically up-regulated gene 113
MSDISTDFGRELLGLETSVRMRVAPRRGPERTRFGRLQVNARNLSALCQGPQRFWPEVPGIYFVHAAGLIKIGLSKNIAARLEDLRTACPVDLTLLYFVHDGDRTQERRFHRRFAAHHSHREWFRYEGELRDWLMDRRVYIPDPVDNP